jgi:hypothetical protein
MPTSRPVSARSTPQQTTTNNSNLLTYVGIGTQDKWNSRHKQNRSMIDHNHNFASHKCTAAITSTAAPAPQAEQQQHHNQRPTTCVSITAAAAAAAKQHHHHSKSHHHHHLKTT